MSDIEVDIRTDENVHGVTDPSAAGPATQSRYNRDLISDQISVPYLAVVLGVPEHPRNLGVHKRGEA